MVATEEDLNLGYDITLLQKKHGDDLVADGESAVGGEI